MSSRQFHGVPHPAASQQAERPTPQPCNAKAEETPIPILRVRRGSQATLGESRKSDTLRQ